MRKTIAELRRQEAIRLAHFKNPQPTREDIDAAISLMNAFYRLRSTKQLEAQTEQRCAKLQQRFAAYGLTLSFCGHLPSIGVCDANGAFYEKISRYFYE